MVDVATLGIAVDSSQADKGARSLDKLSGAARKAEAAAIGVSGASSSSSGAFAKAAAAVKGWTASIWASVKALFAQKKAANDNSAVIAAQTKVMAGNGYQMRMMAMQLSQVAQQTMATGNFMQALAIQIPDMALGFGALGIAIGVVAGVLLPLIPATDMLKTAMNGLADVMVTIAPYAVGAAAAMALLYAPAILGGITLLSEAILGLTARLAGLAIGFTLANPAAAFVVGITAAIAAANIFRDELTQIFGVDIVGAAKNGVNYIIGAFVGGFNSIKAVWGSLPAVLGDIVYSTANKVIAGIEAMVNGSVERINGLISKLPAWMGIGTLGKVNLGGIENQYAGAASGAMAAISEQFNGAMNFDYVGKGIELVGTAASGAAEKVRELAESLGKAGETGKKAGKAMKGAADKAADAWKGLRKATDKTLQKMQEAASTLGNSIGGIFNGLLNKTMTWKDAALAALKSVLTYLNQMNKIQGGSGIFGGGFLQGLIGGIIGVKLAKGGVFGPQGMTAFAKGGVVNQPTVFPFAKGTGLMGEAGPEAIMPLKRGANGSLGVQVVNDNRKPAPQMAQRIEVVPSKYFDVRVTEIADTSAAHAAGKVSQGMPLVAQQTQRNTNMRRIAPTRRLVG